MSEECYKLFHRESRPPQTTTVKHVKNVTSPDTLHISPEKSMTDRYRNNKCKMGHPL